jgi:S-formylglutathione hydrolase FrmB
MMLSRRAMLGGVSAVVVAGAGGAAVVGLDKVLHAIDLRQSPDHRVPPSGWPVAEHRFTSTAMGREVSWAIAEPPQDPIGLVVCLHGRGEDHRYAFETVRLHDVAASMKAPLAIAAVDGGDHSYWHPRRDGTDALAMVLEEFVPAVNTALGRSLPRTVLGWSMGGYGALLVAEQSPATFAAVIAASPALWLEPAESANAAFDDPEDFETFNVFTHIEKLDGLVVRIDCGTSDGFIDRARLFARQLPVPNVGSFSPGYHDASYWRSIAPKQIETSLAAIRS